MNSWRTSINQLQGTWILCLHELQAHERYTLAFKWWMRQPWCKDLHPYFSSSFPALQDHFLTSAHFESGFRGIRKKTQTADLRSVKAQCHLLCLNSLQHINIYIEIGNVPFSFTNYSNDGCFTIEIDLNPTRTKRSKNHNVTAEVETTNTKYCSLMSSNCEARRLYSHTRKSLLYDKGRAPCRSVVDKIKTFDIHFPPCPP